MSTRKYVLPVEQTKWGIEGSANLVFDWEYDEGRDRLLTLYEKGKNLQWNANQRIDWSHALDYHWRCYQLRVTGNAETRGLLNPPRQWSSD